LATTWFRGSYSDRDRPQRDGAAGVTARATKDRPGTKYLAAETAKAIIHGIDHKGFFTMQNPAKRVRLHIAVIACLIFSAASWARLLGCARHQQG
jgi:hypothetical protein